MFFIYKIKKSVNLSFYFIEIKANIITLLAKINSGINLSLIRSKIKYVIRFQIKCENYYSITKVFFEKHLFVALRFDKVKS